MSTGICITPLIGKFGARLEYSKIRAWLRLLHYSETILSDHSINPTRMLGLANDAFFPARSESRTPRAREHAPQTWIGIFRFTVAAKISASGGQPTGTTAFATGCRMSDTAS